MEQITVYSASELKEKFPEGFEHAMEKYQEDCANYGIPWKSEIMDSLKGIFKASGIKLNDWSISDCERSYVKFEEIWTSDNFADDSQEAELFTGRKALNWIKKNLGLKSVKRVNYIYNGKKHFRFDVTKLDGKDWSCEFTGYCADHDFLDSLLNDVTKENCTLSEAFHNLADVAGKLFRNEYEYMMTEEYFLEEAEINEYKFTETGQMI